MDNLKTMVAILALIMITMTVIEIAIYLLLSFVFLEWLWIDWMLMRFIFALVFSISVIAIIFEYASKDK